MSPKRRRTGHAGFEIDSTAGQIAPDIGKFILNFGSIEWLTYIWITELALDDLLLEVASDMPLGKRLDLLAMMIERSRMPKRWKNLSSGMWGRVRKLSEDRNVLAHSPLLLAWKGPAVGPPELVGVPNLRHLKKKHGLKVPISPLHKLPEGVNEVVALARQLSEQLDAYRARQDARRLQAKGRKKPGAT